jgi:1-aminocyclopropane-1-carboxylate deaminase/D-cysteine desulfhydrase-like pyridoxal-dependent ACC family enzyme
MELPLLYKVAPKLRTEEKAGWIPLVNGPTPVHELDGAQDWAGGARLYVKREDATDTVYGGNKVRNLEFLLGDALQKKARKVVTLAPLGSNFVAALAAQSRRVGIPSDIFHFVPAESRQIELHAHFSARQGSRLRISGGGRYLGTLGAGTALLLDTLKNPDNYWISPGGSSALGVLGHINATLELAMQIQRGEIPEPDYLIVGVGTCGTLAGILAGIRLMGLKTRVIGVRCVDPLVCNAYRVVALANAALKMLGVRARILRSDVDLRDHGKVSYANPLEGAEDLIREVKARSGITLDTTYTTKVFSFLKSWTDSGKAQGKSVLYWNTFSPGANLLDNQPLIDLNAPRCAMSVGN